MLANSSCVTLSALAERGVKTSLRWALDSYFNVTPSCRTVMFTGTRFCACDAHLGKTIKSAPFICFNRKKKNATSLRNTMLELTATYLIKACLVTLIGFFYSLVW